MSVFDEPFMTQPGCLGFKANTEAFDFISQEIQGNASTEDKLKEREIETLLSEAFNSLTFEEREKQQETLHGVDKGVSEEANIIESALLELENHLLLIKTGSVYETAEQMDAQYVNDIAFRRMFLRANRYDTMATAYHLLKFFEWKQRLFGTEKLTKDITVHDLDKDDIESLKTGWMQFTGKDRSGRMVFFQPLGLRAFKTMQNELRTKYFILMNLVQSDEEVQLKGIIDLNYAVDEYRDSVHGAGFFEHIDMTIALPLHVAACHYCVNEFSEYIICNLGVRAMPPELRARFHVHFGSHLECQYRLSTFGIVGDNVPLIPGTNKLDMKHHIKWCETYLKEPKNDDVSPVNEPSSVAIQQIEVVLQTHPNDVLYKNGVRVNNGGNLYLRDLIVGWSRSYDLGKVEAKRFVVNEIINEIHKSGGRFLNQADAGQSVWVPIPAEEIRVKITQAFRNNRRKVKGSRRKGF